jgi:RimJ/RimL family protein N-acetyltransferase
LEDALAWIEHHLSNFNADISYEFAITDKASGELYGAIALTNHQKFRNGELAYWIGEQFWGKGYATEAAQAVVQFAFAEKKYHKVYARYFGSNPASGSVMRKIGMGKEGILREHVKKDGRYEDLVYYGILHSANSSETVPS